MIRCLRWSGGRPKTKPGRCSRRLGKPAERRHSSVRQYISSPEMPFSLLSADGQQKYDVRDGAPMLVGRAPTCDVPVFDPTISRRHAELSLVAGGVEILDLGSSNGTFVNGDRVTKTTARGGDVVTFGKVVFKLQDSAPPRPAHQAPAGATIVRSIKASTAFALPTADLEA